MTLTSLTPSEHIPTLTDLELECPPLPQTLLEAIQLMERPEPPEPDEVEAMLRHDPAAVVRLLRVANSAYYGLRGRIGDVRHAIVVLGPPAVVGMIMSMGMLSMKSAFDARTAAPFLNLVRHCAATAYLARLLIQQAPRRGDWRPESAYTVGLLHDFGKILLLYNKPDQALAAFQPGRGPRTPEEEEAVFGYSLQTITQALALHMKLPEPLFRALMDLYGEGRGDGVAATPGALLRVASLGATWLDYSFDEAIRREDEPLDADWELTAQLFNYSNAEAVWQTIAQAREILKNYVDAYF
ncbi:HDOD domain-containing protein [Rhodothermus profundi]|uniref:HD-like signal output (HDOD) domain, no enzymatic activity n=1 Tax=Rhodothermus profundi TaxID=633813 RepID=A0A1M6RE02_9BACT|nr:HDOD domain-containing protein [Rhodothermus profundi]SHK30577.1 HD-like signal output (HDOD) domain, no enzymatic activity [Rhodothermus profundi]